MFAEVILPLAITGTLTYKIPKTETSCCTGMRVLVPLGKNKIRTGIVCRILAECPLEDAIPIKSIVCCLDEKPIVTESQLQLWKWMAEYYLCSIGEVMKAALPSALKLESETQVQICEDFCEQATLSQSQLVILDILRSGKPCSVDELCRQSSIQNIVPTLNQLLVRGAISVSEEVGERYHSKYKTQIALAPSSQNEQTIQTILNGLCRSPKQRHLLETFLSLIENTSFTGSIEKNNLLNQTGESATILKQLVNKGILTQCQVEISRLQIEDIQPQASFALNTEQTQALNEIQSHWKNTQTVLLHGVTSSGKTEVYIKLIEQAIQRGEQVLYLVPEIALTTQLTNRLKRVFGNQLGVYHSRFSDAERVEIYKDILELRNYRVVLGVRSSIFLPFSHLGLIIIDEEHDSSYKQQNPAPRYNGRDTAIMMAHMMNAKVLLGTATPAIETYYKALSGKYKLTTLKHRYKDIHMPRIELIDTKLMYHRKEITGHISDPLRNNIQEQLGKGKQVIIFQNRRGYAPYVECHCGYIPKCPNCDVSLTYHKSRSILACHYCGYSTLLPATCPSCHDLASLQDRGIGTEKIEDELSAMFPNARVQRMDLDTTRTKNAHQQIIDQFAAHKVDILVGTQMVTKGLHFNDVSLVAVLNADALLNQPDFRSYERAFQMLEQVSGRAGRSGEQGIVLVQTAMPDNPIFSFLQQHDYEGFYAQQINERKHFKYPPIERLICLSVRHSDEHMLIHATNAFVVGLQHIFGTRCSNAILPPVPRMQGLYLRQIIVKIEESTSIKMAKALLQQHISQFVLNPYYKGTSIIIDVDPI